MIVAGETFSIAANTTRYLSNCLRANLMTDLQNDTVDTMGQYPGRWNFVQNAPYNFNAILESMAEATTNNMRSSSVNNGTDIILGQAWASETFVETRCLWLILPGTLLLSSLVLICAAVLESRREGVPTWKCSALATLLHGLTEESSVYIAQGASQSEVEACQCTSWTSMRW